MAGVAAALYGMLFEKTQYNVGFLLGIKAFTAAVLGGIGNLRGALIGGIVLGLIENYGAGIFGSEWQNVVAFRVLVLVLMFRPTGILGESLAAGARMNERSGGNPLPVRADGYATVIDVVRGRWADAPRWRAGSSTCC